MLAVLPNSSTAICNSGLLIKRVGEPSNFQLQHFVDGSKIMIESLAAYVVPHQESVLACRTEMDPTPYSRFSSIYRRTGEAGKAPRICSVRKSEAEIVGLEKPYEYLGSGTVGSRVAGVVIWIRRCP